MVDSLANRQGTGWVRLEGLDAVLCDCHGPNWVLSKSCWASLMAHMVKNPSTMWETWV